MSGIRELYGMLKEMVESLERKDFERIMELNKEYEPLYQKLFPPPKKEELPLEYDNTRQSCLVAATMPELYDIAFADARGRFSRIPEPSD